MNFYHINESEKCFFDKITIVFKDEYDLLNKTK